MQVKLFDNSRVLVWFSCGAASACAAKLASEKYVNDCHIMHCDTLSSEHPDNRRFLQDVANWIGKEIKSIRCTTDDTQHRRLHCGGRMRLQCFTCGKSISNEVPEATIVRAVLNCPECVQEEVRDHAKLIAIARAAYRLPKESQSHQLQACLDVLTEDLRDEVTSA